MPIQELPESSKMHAVPQNFMDVEFKLIGDLTMRQFTYLLLNGITAYVIFSTMHGLFKWPLVLFFVLLGLGLAFVPIQERGLDVWVVNLVRAIYTPTQRIWKKQPFIPSAFAYENINVVKHEMITLAPTSSRRKLEEYLKYKTDADGLDPLDIPEKAYIMKVKEAFEEISANTQINPPTVYSPTLNTTAIDQVISQKQNSMAARLQKSQSNPSFQADVYPVPGADSFVPQTNISPAPSYPVQQPVTSPTTVFSAPQPANPPATAFSTRQSGTPQAPAVSAPQPTVLSKPAPEAPHSPVNAPAVSGQQAPVSQTKSTEESGIKAQAPTEIITPEETTKVSQEVEEIMQRIQSKPAVPPLKFDQPKSPDYFAAVTPPPVTSKPSVVPPAVSQTIPTSPVAQEAAPQNVKPEEHKTKGLFSSFPSKLFTKPSNPPSAENAGMTVVSQQFSPTSPAENTATSFSAKDPSPKTPPVTESSSGHPSLDDIWEDNL